MSIGELLKKSRKNTKITQKQLGELIGKSERTIQNYEGNKVVPPLDVLKNISSILNISLESIFKEINYSNIDMYDTNTLKNTLNEALQEQVNSLSVQSNSRSELEQKNIKEHSLFKSLASIFFYLQIPNSSTNLTKDIALNICYDNEFKEFMHYMYLKHKFQNKGNIPW